MAFSTASTGLWKAVDGNFQSANQAMWIYTSSDSAADVASTGYMKNVGVGSNIGLQYSVRVGDIVINVESTGGVTPGRCSLHSVISSTFNASTLSSTFGADCSLSQAATT
jgi:hypothetical protein